MDHAGTFAPSTSLTEVNPISYTEMDMANLTNALREAFSYYDNVFREMNWSNKYVI